MARVNVEARALAEGRLSDLAEELGMPRYQTMGLLVFFWHDSQARGLWKGPRGKLERFIPEKGRRKEIFEAMLRADYVSECTDGEFVIRGNKSNIEALENLKNMAQRGGEASARSRRKKTNNNIESQPAGEPYSILLSSTLPDSILPNSTQSKKTEEVPQGSPTPDGSQVALFAPERKVKQETVTLGRDLGRKVWEAYSTAYRRRYGVEPVRNASVNGQVANLVKRLGGEAPDVAAFYVFHNSAFYVRSKHSVGPMLRDAEGLRTEWATGNRVTDQKAREVERMQTNSDNWDEAAMVLREKGGWK